jgi:raffinose/stachyose/melibiose transport system permease protein
MAAPALVIYVLIVIVPLFQSVWYSFWDWNGVPTSTAEWVGFDNYLAFFTEPQLQQAVLHVLVLVFFFALLPIAIGLVSAALLGRARVRGAGFFQWILFMPQVLTMVVLAIVWRRIYAPQGLLNEALRAVGLDALTRSWLGDFDWALPALGFIGTWVGFGLCTVLFMSGVAAIPSEYYEAARLDGAGPVREFWSITLPNLRGQLAVALTLTVTGALRTFDLVWVMTEGGPGSSTVTPALLLFRNAFQNGNVGQAAAIGIVISVICLAIALVITRVVEGRDK